jgi:hypothetical protein
MAMTGDTVAFDVTAETYGQTTYRWRRDRQVLPHATNAMLLLPNVQPRDAGRYFVTVTHELAWGRYSSTSTGAVLVVTEF